MYIKLTFFIILAIVAVSLIRNSVAKYRSTARSNADVDLAFYMFQLIDASSLQHIYPNHYDDNL